MHANTIFGLNAALGSGLLTAAGAETVYDTTVIIPYAIDGKLFSKAAVVDGVTPVANPSGVTFTGLNVSQACIFVWALDAAGAVKVYQGPIFVLDVDENFLDAPGRAQFPGGIDNAHTPFAYQVVKAADNLASEWNFGTDNWNATGLTSVISNVSVLPNRPQS